MEVLLENLSYITWQQVVMWLIGGMLIFLAISSRARETMERKFFI